MAMMKVIILLLIISSTCKLCDLNLLNMIISIKYFFIVVDARSRRKRRQISSSSYYISNINPYSSSFNPSVPLTYPSGSFYSAPSYGYPNTGYSGDVTYNSNYYGDGWNQYGTGYPSSYQYQYGIGQNYQYPNFGSTYGSGLYGTYQSSLDNYGPVGFNNQFPNWNQGNMAQYFTGGTGSGLTNTGYYWYKSLRNVPFQGRSGDNSDGTLVGQNQPIGPNQPVGPNPLVRQNQPIGPNQPIGTNPPFRQNPPIGLNSLVRQNPPVGPNSPGLLRKSAPVSSSVK